MCTNKVLQQNEPQNKMLSERRGKTMIANAISILSRKFEKKQHKIAFGVCPKVFIE